MMHRLSRTFCSRMAAAPTGAEGASPTRRMQARRKEGMMKAPVPIILAFTICFAANLAPAASGRAVAEPECFTPASYERLTVEAFVFPRSTNLQRILSRYGHATNLMRGWEWQQAGADFTFRFNQAIDGEPGAGLDVTVTAAKALEIGKWTYLATVFDSAGGKVKVFVDGALALEKDIRRLPMRRNTLMPLCIGRYGQSALHPFDGLLDELRLTAGLREPKGMPSAPFIADQGTLLLCHFDQQTQGGTIAFPAGSAWGDGLRLTNPLPIQCLVASKTGFGLALDLKP